MTIRRLSEAQLAPHRGSLSEVSEAALAGMMHDLWDEDDWVLRPERTIWKHMRTQKIHVSKLGEDRGEGCGRMLGPEGITNYETVRMAPADVHAWCSYCYLRAH